VPENPQGVVNGVIPEGRCAMVLHLGSHDCMGDTIYPLYREWLPQSGEKPGDFPLFFRYVNLMPEVAEHELVTEVYLPLKCLFLRAAGGRVARTVENKTGKSI